MKPFDNTRKEVVASIDKRIKKGLTSDAGTIYVYRLHGDVMPRFKIGRTSRSVGERMKEWQYKHKKQVIVIYDWYVSKGCKWMEHMMHLYLDMCRLIRYDNNGDDTFVDFYFSDRTPLIPGSVMGNAMHKHVEWFAVEWKYIEQVAQALVRFIESQP